MQDFARIVNFQIHPDMISKQLNFNTVAFEQLNKVINVQKKHLRTSAAILATSQRLYYLVCTKLYISSKKIVNQQNKLSYMS